MPTEGEEAAVPNAGAVARSDVPTCGLDEKVGDVRERVRAAGWDLCVVVNAERIVLGELGEEQLAQDAGLTAQEAMVPGPGTYRSYIPIAEMADTLADGDLRGTLITTSDGRLVGALSREDALEALHRSHPADSIAG